MSLIRISSIINIALGIFALLFINYIGLSTIKNIFGIILVIISDCIIIILTYYNILNYKDNGLKKKR